MISEPLTNDTCCSPFAARIPSGRMCGATFLRRQMPRNVVNVLVDVRRWCAVHTTCRPGNRMHRTTSIASTKYVLPTWRGIDMPTPPTRSEEHTSELQSREKLVCRLLLEKKKTKAK